MKTYRAPRQLLADVARLLAAKPNFHQTLLDDVIDLVCAGRHYAWMGIYLAVDDRNQLPRAAADPQQLATPEARSKILVSMKLAGRELGVLAVESDRANAFGPEDRVLLKNLATTLARFLAGPGKYLVRKARGNAAASAQSTSPGRKPQSETAAAKRSMAVGEK